MRRQSVSGIALSAIIILSIAVGALAQEARFSARVLTKASGSNLLVLVKNSSKSTESIYEFSLAFTKGNPISSIARGGWDEQKDGNTIKFTTKSNFIKPGGRKIFLVKVSNAPQSAFEWIVRDERGLELQSGEVTKVRVREKKPVDEEPRNNEPTITVNEVRVNHGEQIIVTGNGFSTSSRVEIFLDETQLARSTTDTAGEFSTVLIIPDEITLGAHLITAKDTLGKSSLIQILVEGVGGQISPPQGQLILTVKSDRTEYNPGDAVKITGTAILESPVSLQVTDPQGGIICGANPPVNNVTMTWEATCFIPNDALGGTYTVFAKQIVHKTGVKFTVNAPTTGGTGSTGGMGAEVEDPGTLKLSTDKPSYKTGETVKITLQGARAKSIVQIIIVGPSGPPLEAKQLSTDANGVVSHNYRLVAADPGIYEISARQDQFVVRITFDVIA